MTNYDRLADFLFRWIGSYAKKHGLKSLVVRKSHSYPGRLIEHLCLESVRVYETTVHVVARGDAVDMADKTGGIIVSDITSTQAYARDFHKYHDAADIYPLRDVLESKAKELARNVVPNCPTYPDYHYTVDMEWAMKEDAISGIVSSENPPQQHQYWFRYTIDQKRTISRIHARRSTTKHKDLQHALYPAIPDALIDHN